MTPPSGGALTITPRFNETALNVMVEIWRHILLLCFLLRNNGGAMSMVKYYVLFYLSTDRLNINAWFILSFLTSIKSDGEWEFCLREHKTPSLIR